MMKYILGIAIIVGIGYLVYLGTPSQSHAPTNQSQLDAVTQNDSIEPLIEDEHSDDNSETQEQTMIATFTTNKGRFDIELFDTQAPKTVENFVELAESGFYNGVKFHRVIKGFMIQGGDPLSKDDDMRDRWGTGGPGYQFEDEIHEENHNVTGTIAMANAGPNTNGSQFFINTVDNNYLDTRHTVFGKIVSGIDVVKTIEEVDTLPNDQPVEPVVIEKIDVVK